jgi:hypothetical protein
VHLVDDQRDTAVTEVEQLAGGRLGRGLVVDQHRVAGAGREPAVDLHHGDVLPGEVGADLRAHGRHHDPRHPERDELLGGLDLDLG